MPFCILGLWQNSRIRAWRSEVYLPKCVHAFPLSAAGWKEVKCWNWAGLGPRPFLSPPWIIYLLVLSSLISWNATRLVESPFIKMDARSCVYVISFLTYQSSQFCQLPFGACWLITSLTWALTVIHLYPQHISCGGFLTVCSCSTVVHRKAGAKWHSPRTKAASGPCGCILKPGCSLDRVFDSWPLVEPLPSENRSFAELQRNPHKDISPCSEVVFFSFLAPIGDLP